MFQKRVRVFLTVGLAITLLLSLSAGAFAATAVTKRSLPAVFRNIQLRINGSIFQTEEEPFIVNGSTYVPLRVVAQALGAVVNWDSKVSEVSITGNAVSHTQNYQEQLKQKDAEIAKLKAEIEILKGGKSTDTPGDSTVTVKSLLGLKEKLTNDYDRLEDVKIEDIRLTGNEDELTVNIDVDLEDYDDEWEGLTDSKIKSWVADICLDVQTYFSEDTVVNGRIKDIDSKDTLIEFSKYRTQALKVSYKDKDYRDGKGLDIYDVEDDWENESYTIAGLRFKLKSVKYSTSKDEIDLTLQADSARASEWDAADSDAAEAAIKDLCQNIANSFIEDASANPDMINVKVYDKAQNSLDSFKYDVGDRVLR